MVKFGDAVKAFWKNYAVFTGRSRRSEYWWAVLFLFALSFPIALLDTIMFSSIIAEAGSGPLSILFLLVIVVPTVSLLVRRFHDVGLSGWLVLLTFIPFIGAVFAFVVAVLDSQRGANQFGDSAKYRRGESD